ncbi:hypothetical protein B0H12DRAFT_1072597 [Mycena haematopus]|nr:hypothetical protein B0H12DRAFT_1072597 [Mycena haematopus]
MLRLRVAELYFLGTEPQGLRGSSFTYSGLSRNFSIKGFSSPFFSLSCFLPVRGVRPLPALEVIPSHFVQDACTPALFSDASFACLSCINRAKSSSCDGRQFGTPCKTCKDNNTHCSYKADPERFIGLMEDLRPLYTLGIDALSSALLSVVRARQEADSAYRHLAYRLSVYDVGLTDLIRVFSTQEDILPADFFDKYFQDPSDRELLVQLAERSELVRADMERTFARQHPTSTPYARPNAPDSRPVFNKRYPPDLNPGPSLVDDIPGIENVSPAIFAGGADSLSEGGILPDTAPRSSPPVQIVSPEVARAVTPTFAALEGLGSAGPLLRPLPSSPVTPSRPVPSSFGSFGAPPTSQPIPSSTDNFNPPPLPVYNLARSSETLSQALQPSPGSTRLVRASSLGFRQQRLHLPVVCLEEASAIPELAVIGGCVAQ